MKYNYEWTLKDAKFTKDKGKVFSCFACGGGSTMGYKLAGFDVIGFNEIDPKMAECYIKNHNPKYQFIEPIQTFKNRDDLPRELYDLDILDGSPPCSSFSMAGNREDDWGKEKKFREGQSEQVLDTLFFDFIDLAKKLQPKIVIAENVKGLLMGDARPYVSRILKSFSDAGYRVDFKLLDASRMGVPQKRERVFFYAVRNDIECETIDLMGEQPFIDLDFNEPIITYGEIEDVDAPPERLFPSTTKMFPLVVEGGNFSDVHPKGYFFNYNKVHRERVLNTITAHTNGGGSYHYAVMRGLSKKENCRGGTYPQDYNFINQKHKYMVGMSVPPVMTAQIADRVHNQWLKGIK